MDAQRKESALGRIIACAPALSLSLFGLVAVRIWIQCNLYDRYLSTDSGIVTIASNLFRVMVILALISLVMKREFTERARSRLFAASIAAMTLASALFLANTAAPSPSLLWTACLLAGFGIAWGGGRWICLYVRLSTDEALLYAFASLGASALVGFLLGLMPENVTYLLAMLMPPLSYLAYERAERFLDERNLDAPRDTVYDEEPRSTFVRLIFGIVLFNLALGMARGFPHGSSIDLPTPFQAIHQASVAILCAYVIWRALVAKRRLGFSALWNVSMTFIVLGALTLAAAQPNVEPWGAAAVAGFCGSVATISPATRVCPPPLCWVWRGSPISRRARRAERSSGPPSPAPKRRWPSPPSSFFCWLRAWLSSSAIKRPLPVPCSPNCSIRAIRFEPLRRRSAPRRRSPLR